MSSYYDCSLNICATMQAENCGQVKQVVLDAVIPVLEELGWDGNRESLDQGVDISRSPARWDWLSISLGVYDMLYNPDLDQDINARLQELTDQIVDKMKELPVSVCDASIAGYWRDREPDVGGFSCWWVKREGE